MATEGFGVRIYYGSTALYSTSSWTEIVGEAGEPIVTDVTSPTLGDVDDMQTTAHSPTSHRRTYDPGLIEPGEWSFKALYTDALFNTLSGFHRTKKAWKVIFSDGSKWQVDCYMKNCKSTAPLDGVMEFEAEFKICGLESFTVGS